MQTNAGNPPPAKPAKAEFSRVDEWVHRYRAHWTYKRLRPWLNHGDRVLSLGAGDCRVDSMLAQEAGCEVVSVDVQDFNETCRPLILYDGTRLPFKDGVFDAVLIIFALHHAEDPRPVLMEAQRVCRRRLIVFEDAIEGQWDRLVFRGFHRFLEWSQGIPRPHHEWPPARWSTLATELGLTERWQGVIGRQMGYLASRNIAFVWEIPTQPTACR